MGEVHTLRRTIEHVQRDSVIGMLEDLLEEARAGAYRSVICVLRRTVPRDHLAVWSTPHDKVSNIVGAMEVAKFDLIEQTLDEPLNTLLGGNDDDD